MFSHVVYLFLYALSKVILNSWSDTSNILAIFKPGSNICCLFKVCLVLVCFYYTCFSGKPDMMYGGGGGRELQKIGV